MNSVMQFSLAGWLTKFLERRSLREPDQRMLYQYQATSTEYEELRSALRQQGSSGANLLNKSNSAAFVLFCAEWYRRDFESGWTWDAIWKALGFSLTSGELGNVVPLGLEGYWKRPIRFYQSERRNFLGSIFSEGGLPFRVLVRADSRFQSLLSRILRDYERAEGLGESSHYLVARLIKKYNLPQVFSEDPSVELIAAMSDRLVQLVRLYDLDGKEDPVSALDAASARWRESFPIPMDEKTGTDLLNVLLRSASYEQKVKKRARGAWDVQHYITKSDPDNLKLRLTVPSQLTLILDSIPASCRFEIRLYEGDQQVASFGHAYASLHETYANINIRHRTIRCARKSPDQALSIAALSGGVLLGRIRIEQSQIQLGEVPVVFFEDRNEFHLCGQASVRVKQDTVTLLAPNDADVVPEESAECDQQEAILGCNAFMVKGNVIVHASDGEKFAIHCGVEDASHVNVAFAGKTLGWQTQPQQTFIGVPDVEVGGIAVDLNKKDAGLYISGEPVSESELHERLGALSISYRNQDGTTLLRRRVGILPDDFESSVECGEQADSGSIIFKTGLRCLYKIDEPDIECNSVKHGDSVELRLRVRGAPPPNVNVQITPSLLRDPITVQFPFPAAGVLSFDANQRPLPRLLSVNDLLGSRVLLFSSNRAITHYYLELKLSGRSNHYASYSWEYKVGGKPVEISLYNIKDEIRSLLSAKDCIDQVVDLRISGGRKEEVYRIRRHSTELLFDSEIQVIKASPLLALEGRSPRPVGMLLSEPERPPSPLLPRLSQGVSTSEFEIPDYMQKTGPWLILPAKNSEVTFRPMFVPGGMKSVEDVSNIKSLQKATLAFNPERGHVVFKNALDSMAIDPMHSGWQFLRSLYENYGYLPMATFEAWKALMQNPNALAMALFKFEMDVDFLSRIEEEFPVLGEFMPIHSIRKAGLRFKEFLINSDITMDAVEAILTKWLDNLELVYPVYSAEVKSWLLGKGKLAIMPPSVVSHAANEWYQELIRGRKDESWPVFGSKLLSGWYRNNPSPEMLNAQMDFRSSVVYLPAFAAAVAAGKAAITDVFKEGRDEVFFLRQVRDFDPVWFQSVFRSCLLNFLAAEENEAPDL